MTEIQKITKVEAAKRQFNAAIRLYFANEDPIAVHALLAGGLQILTDLGAKKGLKLGIESGIAFIRTERQAEFRRLMRNPQNFIKHADVDGDEDKVLEYRPATLEAFLTIAINDYQIYTGQQTPEIRVYKGWFAMHNPETLVEDETKNKFSEFLSTYGVGEDDKPIMLKIIEQARADHSISGLDYS